MTSNFIYNKQIEQAMDKWGVSWFKFDESSGNVIDSKGTAVGTVYANATRVTGWNGEGNAMKFNRTSTSYVQFNSKVIPNGTYTLRFKMKLFTKPTAENQEIFNNAYYTADNAGLRIYVNTAGQLVFTACRKSSGNYDFSIVTVAKFDSQWHDYLMSWDATNKIVSLYIDGVLAGQSKSVTQNTLISTYNLRVGRQVVSSEGRYFNGELDDVQIYNKALTPIDFIFNKTLILHNGEYKKFDTTWQTISTSTPTKEQFLSDGMDSISPLLDRAVGTSPLDDLTGDFEIVTWTDETDSTRALGMSILQSPQLVYPESDISLAGVETLDSIVLTATGNAKVAISFDSGATWKVYKNGVWETVTNAHSGMIADEINALTREQIAECKGDSEFIRFSYSLSDDAEVDKIEMRVTLQGVERILPTDAYEVNYDYDNKTIIYNIKRDMTLSVNYVDAK